jgi:hypothetical protein
MRKCPYCAMVSDAADVCEWCKRRYDSYFDVLAAIPKRAPAKKQNNLVKGVVAVAAIAIAIFCLAHIKTAPDAADLVVNMPSTGFVLPHAPVAPLPHAVGNTTVHAPQPVAPTSGVAIQQTEAMPQNGAFGSNTDQTPDQAPETPTVRISSVHISTNNDGSGQETAVGTVTVVNTSRYPIIDFQLSMMVNGSIVALIPFAGNASYPMALTSKSIPPHGSLQVSVATPAPYMIGELASRSVVVEARFQGQSQPASDKVFVGAS